MKDLLYVKNYFRPVFLEDKPEDKTKEKWKVLNLQACEFICQFVEDNVLNHIVDVNSAQDLLKKFKDLHTKKEGVNKMLLIKRLMHLRYNDGTSMINHHNNFLGVVNELSNMGITFEEEILALLLGSLLES